MMSKQDYFESFFSHACRAYLKRDDECKELKAENKRLREALEIIAGDSPDIDSMYVSIARAALGQDEQ